MGSATAPTTATPPTASATWTAQSLRPNCRNSAGTVERVHDPQASGSRDVLEPLLGPHVVVGVEPVELAHEQLVRHAVARGADVAQRRRVGSQLHQGPAGRFGQHGRVAVLGGQVLGHEALV